LKTLLELEHVSINYKREGESELVQAVGDVSAKVNQNERLVLLGPSGCGKSSLLAAIAGFVRLSGGEMRLEGKPISKPSFDRLMVFQEFAQLLPWKTVQGNIKFALHARWPKMTSSERTRRATNYCELVGLGRQASQYPHTLSGGQKQLAAIGRAFSLEPNLLLMDEPFGSLDAITRDRMQAELIRVWAERQATMVFVTHDVAEAARIGHRILVLSRGPASGVAAMLDNVPVDAPGHRDERAMTARLRALLGAETGSAT